MLALVAIAVSVAGGLAYVFTAGREERLADTATQACVGGAVAPSADGIALCDQAAQVQADPVPVIPDQGPPGRGILGTSIVDGRLVVAYTDGTRQDVGAVVGQPGELGPGGVGIAATTIEDGALVVTYTDGRREDVGTVVGAVGDPGRGIADTAAVDGRLIITYDDGEVQDAGPLPAGPMGSRGDQGDRGLDGAPAPSVASVTRTYSDGSIERCERSGGPDSDPLFDCLIESPPPVEPDDGDLGDGGE